MTLAMSASDNVAFYSPNKYSSLTALHGVGKMHGARRVIAFCLLTAVLPTILLITPLYLRHSVYADITYAVAESDILEMANGVSTVFCQAHSLKMNSTFSAFQMSGIPEVSTSSRKHIQLKKSMKLPDDTLEYWGFFLPKGSTVRLSVCARWDGSHILVVKGDKVLRQCAGLSEPNLDGPHMAQGQGQVLVTYEGAAQEILHSDSAGHLEEVLKQQKEEQQNVGSEVVDEKPFEDPKQLMTTPLSVIDEHTEGRKHRHQRTRRKHFRENNSTAAPHSANSTFHERKRDLEETLNGQDKEALGNHVRRKRRAEGIPKLKLDGGIAHGGNAINFTDNKNDSSMSSFERMLLSCYDRHILLDREFAPSELCTSFKYLENGTHLQTMHDVILDGYYYYIFYSDNDFHPNDVHAIFDIFKPTYKYRNYTKGCINSTECTFPVSFLSKDFVVVEVPTRDGIEQESDDITMLQSVCHPRMAVYAIFPVTVLFLILGCAFL